jgi:hypothetical protein
MSPDHDGGAWVRREATVNKSHTLPSYVSDQDIFQHFFIINLGTDNMILGYPVFEASNPNLDWTTGIFPRSIRIQF